MDQATFLKLVEAHQGIIHKICRVYRRAPEDQRDLFQEIVFQLWRSISLFRGEARFSTWMYRIALSTAMADFRKRKPAIRYMAQVPDQAPEPDAAPVLQERLFEAISRLRPEEKALVTLYLEDLSYREIAQISGISENHVGVKLNRIRAKMEKMLKSCI